MSVGMPDGVEERQSSFALSSTLGAYPNCQRTLAAPIEDQRCNTSLANRTEAHIYRLNIERYGQHDPSFMEAMNAGKFQRLAERHASDGFAITTVVVVWLRKVTVDPGHDLPG